MSLSIGELTQGDHIRRVKLSSKSHPISARGFRVCDRIPMMAKTPDRDQVSVDTYRIQMQLLIGCYNSYSTP